MIVAIILAIGMLLLILVTEYSSLHDFRDNIKTTIHDKILLHITDSQRRDFYYITLAILYLIISSYIAIKAFVLTGYVTYGILTTLGLLLMVVILGSLLSRLLVVILPKDWLNRLANISTLYLLLLYPLTMVIYWLHKPKTAPQVGSESRSFCGNKVAREIMVPRVSMVSLPESITIEQALQSFVKHGFSRIPTYQDSPDNVTGVILYKTLLEFFLREKEEKDLSKETIKPLASAAIFTPENRSIWDLFNEMKVKKAHLAIVVNEYGYSEGLITIEDILEEIIGSEIHDEHDINEKSPFMKVDSDSWITDAKITIVDAERAFNIKLPHNPDYETLGGFVCWKMGAIPKAGTILYQDGFKIKIISSDRRRIYKMKLSLDKESKKFVDTIS